MVTSITLGHGLANFFLKVSDSKWLGFTLYSLLQLLNSVIVVYKQSETIYSEWVWLCSNKTLFINRWQAGSYLTVVQQAWSGVQHSGCDHGCEWLMSSGGQGHWKGGQGTGKPRDGRMEGREDDLYVWVC